jgi:hypothetical protein
MPIVSFWLNAFIPRDVPGYTKTLPAGPHAGKTAIPLPGISRAWPGIPFLVTGNTFKDWNAGYLTDQRGFNPSPTNNVRMQSLAKVELAGPEGPTLLAPQTHRSSGTTEVNLASGVQTGFKVADMSRCRFFVLPRRVSGVFTALNVQLEGKAGDPLVGLAADIDYEGTFTVSVGNTPGAVSVSFQGKIDAFPAYDCYASFNGVTKTIFTSSPPPGNTVSNLLGGANRPISGTAAFP